ncbi:MAG: WD40 repeat domain-containing protein [Nitrospirae bacterium]|nr:WD40 repeat domain-containing protein [Nitrospirota bacterium]
MAVVIQVVYAYAGAAPKNSPELVLQSGHGAQIEYLSFSGNGKVLVSRDLNSSIKVWDVTRRTIVRAFNTDRYINSAISISGSGEHLLLDALQGYVDEVLVSSGAVINGFLPTLNKDTSTLQNGVVTAMAQSRDGKYVIICDFAGSILAYNMQEHGVHIIQRSGKFVSSIWVGQDRNLALFRFNDGTVLLNDLDTSLSYGIDGFTMGDLDVAAITATGDILVASEIGSDLRVINLTKGQVKTLPCRCQEPMLSADGTKLVALEGDKDSMHKLHVWSTADMREIATVVPPKYVYRAALNGDGTMAAFGGFDGTVSILPITDKGVVNSLTHKVRIPVAIQWRGEDTLAVTDLFGNIRAWDLKEGAVSKILDSGLSAFPVLSSDGRFGVSRIASGELLIGAAETQKIEHTGITVSENIYFMAVSDEGDAVAWASANLNTTEMVDRISAAAEALSNGNNSDSLTNSQPLVRMPLKLARRDNGKWVVKEVCVADKVPSATFAGKKLLIAGCSVSPANSTLEYAEPGVEVITSYGDRSLLIGKDSAKLIDQSGPTTIPLKGFMPISAAISPDGKFAAVVRDRSIDVIDLPQGTVKTWAQLHASGGSALSVKPRAHLIAISNEQTVYVVDGEGSIQAYSGDGKPLFRLIGIGSDGWVVVDNNGRFDTDNVNRSGAAVKWRMADAPGYVLPLEIFIRDYYYPHLAWRVLTGKPPLAEIPDLNEVNRTQPIIGKITITPEETSDMVTVAVEAASTRGKCSKGQKKTPCESGVYDLRLFRDGQLVAQKLTLPEALPLGNTHENHRIKLQKWRRSALVRDRETRPITVAGGKGIILFEHVRVPKRKGVDNVTFTAYAFNSDRVKSETSTPVLYKLSKHRQPAKRLAYLITVGVNANESQSPWRLGLAVASAERAKILLKAKLLTEYSDVVEIPLYAEVAPNSAETISKQASKAYIEAVFKLLAGKEQEVNAAIRKEVDLNRLIKPATPDDAVVLYMASHGFSNSQGTYYMIPYDTGAHLAVTEDELTRCTGQSSNHTGCQEAEDFLSYSISSDDLSAWWRGVDAGELVMILDSCHSGAVSGREFRPAPLGDRSFGQLGYDKGMRILVAAQPAQIASGDVIEEGEGRTLLSEALEQIASSYPGRSLAEWLKTAVERVPANIRQRYPELKAEEIQAPQFMDFTSNPELE